MPDHDGKLTDEEREKAVAWLNEKTKNYECPVCGTNNWAIGQHIIQEDIYRGGNVIVGGSVYPTVFVVCTNCAYVRHFMAIQMGVIDPKRPKEERAPKSEKEEPKEAGGANA